MTGKQLFDDWADRYDLWFETPVGAAVLKYESDLVLDLLRPAGGERILDVGCGTGIFTREFIRRGAELFALDISFAMIRRVAAKAAPHPLPAVTADMLLLPFADETFDKTVSVTALEFVTEEKQAVSELFRVTRRGGVVVVATLNSLNSWAIRRRNKARRDPDSIFNRVFFRSAAQLLEAAPFPGVVRTAVHFGDEDDPAELDRLERAGLGSGSGAFIAVRWVKT